jgi:hypothetical protein
MLAWTLVVLMELTLDQSSGSGLSKPHPFLTELSYRAFFVET